MTLSPPTDRYLCICCPHSHVLDAARARNTSIVLLFLAMGYGIVPTLLHGVYIDSDTLIAIQGKQLTDRLATLGTNVSNVELMLAGECVECGGQNETTVSPQLQAAILDYEKVQCAVGGLANESSFFTGICGANAVLLMPSIFKTYKNIYASSFLLSFSTVFFLYILIYRSVLKRRRRRMVARTKHMNITQEYSLTEAATVNAEHSEIRSQPNHVTVTETSKLDANNESDKQQGDLQNSPFLKVNASEQRKLSTEISETNETHEVPPSANQRSPFLPRQSTGEDILLAKQGRSSSSGCLKDKYFLANIRTAMMLFVVTIAFIIAFLPSWLIAYKVMDFDVIIYYVYFSNHIVNPIIYAFMNPAFRRSLKELLLKGKTRAF